MGTLRATLKLSSADVFTTAVDLSTAVTVTADGGNISRGKILQTAVGGGALVIYKASDKLENAYIYLKNLSNEKEDYVYLYNDLSDDVVLKLGGGEFAFMPVKEDQTYKAYGTKVDQIVEYASFGLDSSAVNLS